MAPHPNARRFIRHPLRIPITCAKKSHKKIQNELLRDISLGGLAFYASSKYVPGDSLQICYPVLGEGTCLHGEVIWCDNGATEKLTQFSCGVRFDSGEMLFRARLVEQMCHIEAYRQAQEKLGRELSGEDAAREWIPTNAHKFPQIVNDP